MANTEYARVSWLALLADNFVHNISAQDLRNALVSIVGGYGGIHTKDGTEVTAAIGTSFIPTNPFGAAGTEMPTSGLLASDGDEVVVASKATGIITVNVAGDYEIHFGASIEASAIREFRINVHKNDVETDAEIGTMAHTGSDPEAFSSSVILTLADGDALQLYIESDNAMASTVTWREASFWVKRL